MDNSNLHEYFSRSYTTGTDIWTHVPTDREIIKACNRFIEGEQKMVLDIGCGRGLLDFELARKNQQVLGIDVIPDLIKKNNEEVINHRLIGTCGFVLGSGLDIPFSDSSFDYIIDSGFMHHLYSVEYETYKNEVTRVLKNGGFIFQATYSLKTSMLLGIRPHTENRNLEKYGLHYHFFDQDELLSIFEPEFTLREHIEEIFDSRSDPGERLTYNICVWQKNSYLV